MLYEHQDFKQWQKQKVLYLASGLARNDRTLGVSEFYANMRLPHILHVATFFAYFNRMHISHIFPHKLAFLMAILIILIFLVMSILRHKHWYTHSFNGPLSETTQVSRYQKGKTNLDFTEARDSEWQWHQLGHMQICTSLQTNNYASTPPLSFFTVQMPFLPPNQHCQSTEGMT